MFELRRLVLAILGAILATVGSVVASAQGLPPGLTTEEIQRIESVFPATIADGQVCGYGRPTPGGFTRPAIGANMPARPSGWNDLDQRCASRACWPGPSQNINASDGLFYCVARSRNCAVPGSSGVMYGARVGPWTCRPGDPRAHLQ